MVKKREAQTRLEVERREEESVRTHMDDGGRIWQEEQKIKCEKTKSQRKYMQEEEFCGMQQSIPR